MRMTVKFESDWHVGSGMGIPGFIDHLIGRDADGLPFLPAKTLTGILRDGCELVASILDEAPPASGTAPHAPLVGKGGWASVVESLFGPDVTSHKGGRSAAAHAKLRIRRGRLPEAVRKILLTPAHEPLRRAMTFVAPHVGVDPETGRALDEHLYFVEIVRCGGHFVAEITLYGGDLVDAEKALLFAGATAVRSLGGKRRRGLGACRILIEGLPAPPDGEWLDWLEAHDPAPIGVPASVETTPPVGVLPSGVQWQVVPYAIEARSPLCMFKRAIGNQLETLDFVPGTQMLPLVARALYDVGLDARRLVRNGEVVVTPGLPEVPGVSGSTLPVPQVLAVPKGGPGLSSPDGDVVNLLLERADAGSQVMPYRAGYVAGAVGSNRPSYVRLEPVLHMHNVVEDRSQRPTEEVGGLYSYEALQVGTRFRGEIRVRGDVDVDGLIAALRRLAGGYALGRSKKDDYGEVVISFGPRSQPADTASPTPSALAAGRKVLTVWLVSDVLVRDAWLGWDPSAEGLARELGGRLGLSLEVAPEGDFPTAFGRGQRLEGWVRAWNLPRPTLACLAAGSVYVLEVKTTDPAVLQQLSARIADVEISGIGERRAEGFGQVRIDPPLLAGPIRQGIIQAHPPAPELTTVHPDPREQALPVPAAIEANSESFLQLLERVAWKQAIRDAALAIACKEKAPLGLRANSDRPPSSQLGALRTAAAQHSGTGADDPAIAWLSTLRATDRRARLWPASTLDKIGVLLCTEDEIWKQLFPKATPVARTPERAGQISRELRAFAVRTLLGAVCRVLFDRREGAAAIHREESRGSVA